MGQAKLRGTPAQRVKIAQERFSKLTPEEKARVEFCKKPASVQRRMVRNQVVNAVVGHVLSMTGIAR